MYARRSATKKGARGDLMKRIKKIKVSAKDGKISMDYEVLDKGRVKDEHSFTSLEPALPSLYEALSTLAQDVVEMCELPAEDLDRIIVTGVSFSYAGEHHTMGATITAQKKLAKSNQPLILNTPHKIEDFYGQTGSFEQLLEGDCLDRLKMLQKEAERYIDGERSQSDMFQKEAA